MSLEAIKEISKAEELAGRARQEAELAGRRLAAQAKEDGESAVSQAAEKARNELSELKRTATEHARQKAVELARNTENRKAAMLVRAESRIEQAVQLVIEGIVRN